MKVFISWSKDKSKLTAEALNKWLPKVIQAVEPWISPDIEKGKRWSQEINDNLEKTKIGIFCLNQENLNEPWILFEAGAMAKTKDAYVCTFLLDIKPTDVHQPLGQFQHTKYEKEDIRKLVHTINSALGKYNEKELTKEVLDEAFEKYWVDLDEELKKILKSKPSKSIERTEKELLEEILEILRNQQSSNTYGTSFGYPITGEPGTMTWYRRDTAPVAAYTAAYDYDKVTTAKPKIMTSNIREIILEDEKKKK